MYANRSSAFVFHVKQNRKMREFQGRNGKTTPEYQSTQLRNFTTSLFPVWAVRGPCSTALGKFSQYNTGAYLVLLSFPMLQRPVVLSYCNRYIVSCCCAHVSLKTFLLQVLKSVWKLYVHECTACEQKRYFSVICSVAIKPLCPLR